MWHYKYVMCVCVYTWHALGTSLFLHGNRTSMHGVVSASYQNATGVQQQQQQQHTKTRSTTAAAYPNSCTHTRAWGTNLELLDRLTQQMQAETAHNAAVSRTTQMQNRRIPSAPERCRDTEMPDYRQHRVQRSLFPAAMEQVR